MTTRNHRVRFCNNNQAAATAAVVSVSSASASFPATNALDLFRWKKWRPTGAFTVDATNNKIYIADGSNKTITLTSATYATGTLMAAHIQTQLNASSTLWTCTYSTTTWKFTIGRSSGTATLRLTQTTAAAWSMLGYTGVADFSAGTGTAANEQRNHTSETWSVDLGSAKSCPAFFVFGAADELFAISTTATVTLKANSINDFTAPPLSVTITPETTGIFKFLDDLSDYTYRYWKFEFIDKTNAAGPDSFNIHQIYLGDYVTPLLQNVDLGFTRKLVDPSVVATAEGGTKYYRKRAKYWKFSNTQIRFITETDRVALEALVADVGITDPFVLALDPTEIVSASLGEWTKIVTFDEDPEFEHIRYQYHQFRFVMSEVV